MNKYIFSIKKALHNVIKILKLQFGISKKPAILEVVSVLTDKTQKIIRIIFAAVVIDLLTNQNGWYMILSLVVIFGASIAGLSFVSQKCKDLLSVYASKNDNSIMLTVNEKALKMDYIDVTDSEGLKQIMRAKSAMGNFLEIDYVIFYEMLGSLFTLTVLGFVLARLDPIVLIAILLFSILHYLLRKKQIKTEHKYEMKKSEYKKKHEYLNEVLFNQSYGKDIRIYNGADFIKAQYINISNRILTVDCQKERKLICLRIIKFILKSLQIALIYLWAVIKYMNGAITIGSITVYLTSAREISDAIQSFFDSIANIFKVSLFFEDYERCMAVPEKIAAISDDLKYLDCAKLNDFELEFKNVSFKYSGSSDYALKGISFKIRNNETISIVGENGAGKTTLAYLILRLFDVTEGEICINGVDIRKYSFSEYRNLIAPVFQDYEIMSYSLRENVIFDKPLDENKLQTCYCAAGLLEKVRSLSNGDNTILTKDIYENGEDLSGGEKQKLSIARAYYQDGKILILDEPTSSIDPIAEYSIFKNINDYNYGKAKIFITHRLTSTAFSDKIIVLDKGKIQQIGTHTQLVHSQGLYKEMYDKQAYYYLKKQKERQ